MNSASQETRPTNTNNAAQSQPGPSNPDRQSQFHHPHPEPQPQQQHSSSNRDRGSYHYSFPQPQQHFNSQSSTNFGSGEPDFGSHSFGSQSKSFRGPSYSFNGQPQSFGGGPSTFTGTTPNFTHTYPTSNSQGLPNGNPSSNFPFDLNDFAEFIARIIRSELSQPRPTVSTMGYRDGDDNDFFHRSKDRPRGAGQNAWLVRSTIFIRQEQIFSRNFYT